MEKRLPMTTETGTKPLAIPRTLTVRELADLMGVSGVQVIKALMVNGIMADVSKTLDYDTAAVVAVDMGFAPTEAGVVMEEPPAPTLTDLFTEPIPDDPATLRPRPPVVAVLGHVDHGKTTLLDAIRNTRVTEGEAGGITQHMGAYQAEISGRPITFLDTPGHEAFTQMRARGAEATDIAILVVAADDGVMPQTREAMDHIRAAGVPMIVALTKIDLDSARPDRVKAQLSEANVLIEEYGGDVPLVPVSGVTRAGIADLLETILLVAEIAALQANPDRPAAGVVLEAELDRRQGARTTLLVQRGTLHPGDALVVGQSWGKIRAMFDYTGAPITTAAPSAPVSVLGIQDVAAAGDRFRVVESDRRAKTQYETARRQREALAAQVRHAVSLDALFGEISKGAVKELNLIAKTDVQGSVEPIRQALDRLTTPEVHVKVIHSAPGAVSESDVNLALAAHGVVLAFNTGVEPGARKLADQQGVEIRQYAIIYELLEDVQAAITGMLAPVEVEIIDGHAEVLQVFPIRRLGNVAGCRLDDGHARPSLQARVRRDSTVIATGALTSLRRFDRDARDVQAGQEFGVAITGFDAWQPGDQVEFFHTEMQSRAVARGRPQA